MNKILVGNAMVGDPRNTLFNYEIIHNLDMGEVINEACKSLKKLGLNIPTRQFDFCYYNYLNPIEQLSLIYRNENGSDTNLTNSGGFFRKENMIICEYVLIDKSKYKKSITYDCSCDTRVIISIDLSRWEWRGCVYNPINDVTTPFTPGVNGNSKINAEACIFAYLALMHYINDNQYYQHLLDATNLCSLEGKESKRAFQSAVLAFELQYLMQCTNSLIMEFCNVVKQAFPLLDTNDDIETDISFGDLYGYRKSVLKEVEETPNAARIMCLKDLYGSYNFDKARVRTDEERAIIEEMKARIDPDTEVPSMVLDIATEIQKSTNLNFKFRDYMLKGPTGTGKTTMCVMLGLLLDLPVLTFNCDPDTDQLALGLSIVPNAQEEGQKEITLDQFLDTLPDLDEITFDPEDSYLKITGESKANASASDCQREILLRWNKICAKQANGFRYVYSNIAKAMKNGWIIEVQEPTVIQRAGVLTALNSLTDDCAKMELANGETIHRHPDAIMIYTTNLNLEGCYEMNQSQKSRFAQRTVELPEEEIIVQRLMNATGYTDKETAIKMVRVYQSCYKFASSRAITDGAIDFRGLQAWATANMIFPDKIYQNGLNQFIEKCTDDQALKSQFVVDCLNIQFKPKENEKKVSSPLGSLRNN